MTEPFELPVTYKGEIHLLEAELQSWGYSHRIIVKVDDQSITFEPDEERNYRAIVAPGESFRDTDMLASITETLEASFK